VQAIVFSNNSPDSLDLFLSSAQAQNIKGLDFAILYNCKEEKESKYQEVFSAHKISSFKKEHKFKEDLLELINDGNHELVAFFKDTNYFYGPIPEIDIQTIMSDDDIFCFSLALGRNIKHCYANDVYNILLNEEENTGETIKWNWVKHYLDFGRPLELGAGHVFHKREIFKMFKKWKYETIQGLEESFDNLDYYPKEFMSSLKNGILVDLNRKSEDYQNKLKLYDFNNLDRLVLEI
jgi:hypothetical protein